MKTRRNIHFPPPGIPFFRFWAIVSLVYALTVVPAELSSLPLNDFKSLAMAAGQWGMISVCAAALIGVMSISRIVFACLFTPLLLFSAAIAFFSVTIGTGLTGTTIEIALVNDTSMWGTMISPGLILTLAVALAAGIYASVVRWKKVTLPRGKGRWWFAVFAVIAAAPFVAPQRVTSAMAARMPYAIWFGFRDYFINRSVIKSERHTYDGISASAPEDAPDVIVVLGESLRADHIPMNCYHRNTMPLMSNDTAAISFPEIKVRGFHTHAALPLMLTDARDGDQSKANEEQSFITLFKKAGFTTAWLANQDLSSSYAYFAHEADTLLYTNASRSMYVYSQWFDTELLPPLEQWLDSTYGKRHLAVLHTIGSHWWYKSHYSDADAIFLPDTDSKDIGTLSHEKIINAYDNSIVATDRFLSALTSMMRERNAIVIFFSDHGEALGEDGRYLHGTDHEAIHNPACIVWTSPAYRRRYPEKIKVLEANRGLPASEDVLFHTALHAGEISTPAVDLSLSLLNDNRKETTVK